jgi:hypothetical protein
MAAALLSPYRTKQKRRRLRRRTSGRTIYAYVGGNPVQYADPLGLESPGSFNNGGYQISWERGSNVRAPDYVRVHVSLYVFNASRIFSRSGGVYLAGGMDRGYPAPSFKPQVSFSFGWLNQCESPEGSKVDDFLSGYSMEASGYYGLGGGVVWSPGSGTATEIGIGVGFGVSPGAIGVQMEDGVRVGNEQTIYLPGDGIFVRCFCICDSWVEAFSRKI